MPDDPSSIPDVLLRICANTRAEVAARKSSTSLEALRQKIIHGDDAPDRKSVV